MVASDAGWYTRSSFLPFVPLRTGILRSIYTASLLLVLVCFLPSRDVFVLFCFLTWFVCDHGARFFGGNELHYYLVLCTLLTVRETLRETVNGYYQY